MAEPTADTDPPASRPRIVDRLPGAAVVGLSVGVGLLVTVQARINTNLSQALDGGTAHTTGHSVLAALTSFAIGWLIIAAIVAARPVARAALARFRSVPWLLRFGGLGGATLVASQAITVPTIGLTLFFVTLVASQTTAGLGVDHAGFGPAGHTPVTPQRLVGAVVAVVAVAVGATDGGVGGGIALGAIALVAVAGSLTAVQQACNGRVNETTGDARVACLVNFTVGGVALVVVTAGLAARGDLATVAWPGEPWLYAGGACGVAFITMGAAVVHRLGVLGLLLGAVFGQLAASLVLDQVIPGEAGRPGWADVAGTGLTGLAVLLVATAGRRPPSAPLTLIRSSR